MPNWPRGDLKVKPKTIAGFLGLNNAQTVEGLDTVLKKPETVVEFHAW
jgi:hypothetical protein